MTKTAINKQAEELLAPVKVLNELALTNVERLVELQVDGIRKYSTVGLENWKAALKVTDLEGAQEYLAKQGQVAQSVVESLVGDAKAVAALGRDYVAEVQKVTAANVAKVTKKAA